jgi:23S rRNA (cytidine2498-2'-O)-methyltransferase
VTETRIHLFRPDRGDSARRELSHVFSGSEHRLVAPGVVESALDATAAAGTPTLAFVAQTLPNARSTTAPSVAAWADVLAQTILGGLADHSGPWRLHVVLQDGVRPATVSRRCRLIDEGLTEVLRKRQRRLLRARIASEAAWATDEAFVQLCLTSPEAGFVSLGLPEVRHRLRRCLSRFPGGEVTVSFDRRPPSRAYLKLLEAQARLGRRIHVGETCVDLGASPGGWTWVALEQGGQVIAVDRTPLRADLMKHRRLTFEKGDAFKYAPTTPIDWLLCDVIAFPERTLEIVDRWILGKGCRFFCVTMKFRGDADYERIEDLARRLAGCGAEFSIRQLNHNKNEVTAYGEVSSSDNL